MASSELLNGGQYVDESPLRFGFSVSDGRNKLCTPRVYYCVRLG